MSKGKREHFVCEEGAERTRFSRLDRDADESNAAWDALARGDLIAIHPRPDVKKNRIARGAGVVRLEPRPARVAASQGEGLGVPDPEDLRASASLTRSPARE